MSNHPNRSKHKKASPMYQESPEDRANRCQREGRLARRRGDSAFANPYYRGSDDDAGNWSHGYELEMRDNNAAAKANAAWKALTNR